MKLSATLAVASALALVSAQDLPVCGTSVITAATTGVDAEACKAMTGFSAAAALASFPTADVVAKACANANCMNVLQAVIAAAPAECTFGGIKLKADIISKIEGVCKGGAGSGSGAGGAVIKAPTPSSAKPSDGSKPKEEVTAGSGGSASPAASQAAKPVPSPSPTATKSSASTVAAATGTVVLAVAASML
jgi:hypothetical protein